MRNSDPNLDLNDQKEEPEVKPNKVVSPIQIEGFCYYFWRNILFFVINLLGENQNSWIYRCKYRNLKKCDGRISIPKKFNFKALESEEERKTKLSKSCFKEINIYVVFRKTKRRKTRQKFKQIKFQPFRKKKMTISLLATSKKTFSRARLLLRIGVKQKN